MAKILVPLSDIIELMAYVVENIDSDDVGDYYVLVSNFVSDKKIVGGELALGRLSDVLCGDDD